MAKSFFILFVLLIVLPELSAKDIDLDKIYIKKNSRFYKRLFNKKIDIYRTINSDFVDSNIIFANWINGDKLIYVKELPAINIIYSYNRKKRQKAEILRLKGVITVAKISPDGKYFFLKRLYEKKNNLSIGETLILDLRRGSFEIIKSAYFFLDFSISLNGNSFFYEGKFGIYELNLVTDIKKTIFNKSLYSDIKSPNAPTILYMSPNRKMKLILNGSGGFYRSKIISERGSWKINGITSASEVCWIDNYKIIFRKGFSGNYSLHIYDTFSRKIRKLISNTLNTNLNFSSHPGIVTYLKNQIIHIYFIKSKQVINTGIEGEDVTFSPDGNYFISLLFKKLFITNINLIKNQSMRIQKNSKLILQLYKDLIHYKSSWESGYTLNYLRKKVAIYKIIAGE